MTSRQNNVVVIAVDEDGTEAAAATTVLVAAERARVTEPLHVDRRPYLPSALIQ